MSCFVNCVEVERGEGEKKYWAVEGADEGEVKASEKQPQADEKIKL